MYLKPPQKLTTSTETCIEMNIFSDVKASSHIDEIDPTSSCAYRRIGLQPNSILFVNVRFKSLAMFARMRRIRLSSLSESFRRSLGNRVNL